MVLALLHQRYRLTVIPKKEITPNLPDAPSLWNTDAPFSAGSTIPACSGKMEPVQGLVDFGRGLTSFPIANLGVFCIRLDKKS